MRFWLCAAGLLVFGYAAAQRQQLAMYPSFGGAHFEYEKDTMVYSVSPRQVGQILRDDPMAYDEFKKARRKATFAGILGFIGAGLIVIPVTSLIAGSDPEWAFAAGGGALIIGSIPLSASARHHAQNAVDTYNKNHVAQLERRRVDFFVSGTKLVVRF